MSAVATPWKTIYILQEAKDDWQLIAHELAHIHQMQRDGQLKYWSRYYWWLITRGYRKNPYEIEARQLADRGMVGVLGRRVIVAARIDGV